MISSARLRRGGTSIWTIKPVIEVFPEGPFLDHLYLKSIGSSNDSDINIFRLQGSCAAPPAIPENEAALLKIRGVSPISSKKTVPPSAASSRPLPDCMAPVEGTFVAEQLWFSRLAGIAPQFRTIGVFTVAIINVYVGHFLFATPDSQNQYGSVKELAAFCQWKDAAFPGGGQYWVLSAHSPYTLPALNGFPDTFFPFPWALQLFFRSVHKSPVISLALMTIFNVPFLLKTGRPVTIIWRPG